MKERVPGFYQIIFFAAIILVCSSLGKAGVGMATETSVEVPLQESIVEKTPQQLAVSVAPSQPSNSDAKALELPVPVMKSIFFSDAERDAIAAAKKQFLDRMMGTETEEDLLDQIKDIKAAARAEESEEKFYPQFYLETLMYHTPKDWILWVRDAEGGIRITPETVFASDAPFRILSIGSEAVKFEWHPRDWEHVSSEFKADNKNITLNDNRKSVTFVLGVNQTFMSLDVTIQEGRVTPVAIVQNVAPDGTEPSDPSAAAALPAKSSADQKAVKQVPILELYKEVDSIDKKP